MIRVIFLLKTPDLTYRQTLIEDSIAGRQWKKKGAGRRVTDRDMVNISNTLQGWTESVYKFGCGFIHLSPYHDYKDRDPMDMITAGEKHDIIRHMRAYHHGPMCADPRFSDIAPYLPQVFEKITANLECYLNDLAKGASL
ncbi:MAG TPA: hypothetical protein VJX67_03770 [Blastocatellia bacterium]|nr:hypothetical protein [Blastocatellia bacterium]